MKQVHKPDAAEPAVAPERAPAPATLTTPSPGGPLTPARIVALQRLVGNAAVAALVDDRRGTGSGAVTTAPLGPSILDDVAAAANGGLREGEQGDASGAAAGGAAQGVQSGEGAAAAGAAPEPNAAEGAAAGPAAAFDAAAGGAASPAAHDAGAGGAATAGGAASGFDAVAGGTSGANGAAGSGATPAAAGGSSSAAAGAREGAAAEGATASAAPFDAASGGGAGANGAAGAGASASTAGGAAANGAAAGARDGSAAAGGSASAAAGGSRASAHVEGAGAGAAAGGGPAAGGGAHAAAEGGAAAAAGPAAVPVIKDPHADPKFQAMKGRTKTAATGSKAHAPAAAGAAAAQGAALPPANDASSQAQAAQVDTMSEQKPGTFDRAAFIAAVKEAIDKAAPKNLEEADDFKADGVKDAVGGQVKDGKKGAEKDIKGATDAQPDPSKAKPKQVTPMAPEDVGSAPGKVGAKDAMPDKLPAEATDLSHGPAEVDKQMADAEVTDEQIHKSNEPDFKAALGERDKLKDHAKQAPEAYRSKEQDVLAKAHGGAEQVEAAQLGGMHGARTGALGKAQGHKQGAKSADEAKRAKVANDIQGIYDRTKADVTKTLDGLDGKVDAAFTQGESGARKRFEDYVSKRMDAYKDDRYGGILGPAKWLKDKLMGLPGEVNQFYADGRKQYLADMDGVIGKVADLVGAELTSARARIAQGQGEVHKYVTGLPKDLQDVGKEAEEKLQSQFEQLQSDVDSKQDELVDTLAKKYVDARDALDARIDEMKAANRGLVDKAIDAIGGVIKTIIQLKNMLMSILAKAAEVIGDIIKDPIGFLGKLIDGIKSGLNRFVGNIAAHLQEGLMGWLFGALGGAGITIPKTFDLAGIVDLVVQVLGLTYQNIRARVVRIVGEPVMQRMEQTVDVFKTLVTEGVGGLWRWIKDRVGDLEDLVLGSIKTFIIEKVIKAGVVWLIAFLNPAAAFIKACKMIVDVITFLIERGSEIMAFVNSILDSVGAIAKGAIGVVAEKVESSLAKALPLAISFLASLLGLGGISDKIHQVIDKVRAPINKAVDFVVMGAVKGFRKLFGKVRGKYEKGKKWAKDKAQGAKDWATGKARGVRDRFTGKGKPGAEPAAATADADGADVKHEAARRFRERAAGPIASVEALREIVGGILGDLRPKGLKDMKAVPHKEEPGKFDVLATASPTEKVGQAEVAGEEDPELALLNDGVTSLEDRRAALNDARGLAGTGPIAYVLDSIRNNRIKAAKALDVLRRIVSNNLTGGYKLTTKEKPDRTYGRVLEIDYFGLHDFNNNFPKVARVPRAANNPLALGLGYVKPIDKDGTPVPALGVDFLVPPAVEAAGIAGVGSAMMKIAAEHFKTQYEAVVGEWYTARFYASRAGNRPPQSKNLTDYLAARKAGASPEEAAATTWTYRRVKEIYGGAELELQVRELVTDLDNLPPEAQIVEVLMKPR